MRVNALVQIAHGISQDRSDPERPYADLRVTLGATRHGAYRPALSFANGDFDLASAVARGEVDLAAMNPSAYLTMAYRGTGPYAEPLPVRAIATMPTLDLMLFAVSEGTGLRSIADIREGKVPLHVSIRRSRAHGTRFVIDEVFAANGFSLADLETWGGRFHYVDAPNDPGRLEAMRDGTLEAVFDEGVKGWGHVALDRGMTFLDLGQASCDHLEGLGWPVTPARAIFPTLPESLLAPSFSGWPLFTRASLPDAVAYQMARALDAAADRLVFDSAEPVRLSDLCEGTDAAPRDVPLHPGAERYYRERGCKV
jgi:TRAP-type uncharacterized transport system substrate-binding protein